MRAIGASEKIASVAAGRMQLLEARPEQLEIAGDQAVDQIEARHLRRRAEEHVEPPERRRRPAEQVIEDVDQDQPGEEHRQRHARRRDHAAGMVDQRAGVASPPRMPSGTAISIDTIRPSSVSSADAGSRALDLLADRLAGGQRIAEIAVGEIVDVVAELHDQRLVEAKLHPDLLDRLLGRGRSGEIGRRIAGQRAGQQERDDDDADQARHRHQHPLEDHAQHGCDPSVAAHSASGSPWPDQRGQIGIPGPAIRAIEPQRSRTARTPARNAQA